MKRHMLLANEKMNIDEFNRKHYIHKDIYTRIGLGLSSKLIKYQKGVIYLEIELTKKWKKSVNSAVLEITNLWRKEYEEEFKNAIACKLYIINSREYEYKRSLQHMGIRPGFDHIKGIIFEDDVQN